MSTYERHPWRCVCVCVWEPVKQLLLSSSVWFQSDGATCRGISLSSLTAGLRLASQPSSSSRSNTYQVEMHGGTGGVPVFISRAAQKCQQLSGGNALTGHPQRQEKWKQRCKLLCVQQKQEVSLAGSGVATQDEVVFFLLFLQSFNNLLFLQVTKAWTRRNQKWNLNIAESGLDRQGDGTEQSISDRWIVLLLLFSTGKCVVIQSRSAQTITLKGWDIFRYEKLTQAHVQSKDLRT